jgi:hypothetical protein
MKRPSTRFVCKTAEGFSNLTHLPKIVFSCFRPLSAFCSCCSVAITTYVLDLAMTFPPLLIVTFSTSHTNYWRLMSVIRGRTQMISPSMSRNAQRKSPIRKRRSSRRRASSIALGSEVRSLRTTLAAFSASFARAAPGAWIPLVSVVSLVIRFHCN